MSVNSLALSTTHVFSKTLSSSLNLLPGLGVEGDCHCGETVQHRSRLHIRPPPKNLRQVHLMDLEILEEFEVQPGDLGENVTTQGLRLLERSRGTKLHFLPSSTSPVESVIAETPNHPVVVLTGLRNPCPQIHKFRPGLQEKFIVRDEERKIIERKAGVMSTVEVGGVIEVGMRILLEEPAEFQRLEPV